MPRPPHFCWKSHREREAEPERRVRPLTTTPLFRLYLPTNSAEEPLV
jgi:hypothetical protein